jgi:hypothetical protein
VRPERFSAYEEAVRRLAERAIQRKEGFRWTAHQTAFGELGTVHFVSEDSDWTGIGTRGLPEQMVRRVMGEEKGQALLEELNGCILGGRSVISTDRPDLSCPPEEIERTRPAAAVTTLRVRPGGQEAFEELMRKIAEAVPKVDDPGRLITYQPLVGNLRTFWVVRPLQDLAELDDQLQPEELLTKAFGAAEGGLIFRSGLEALEDAERQIVLYREDLSNPS